MFLFFQDTPLNLCCKEKKLENGEFPTCKLKSTKSSNPMKQEVKHPGFLTPLISNTVMEQAFLQHQAAQILASNDYLRALAHQTLQESYLRRSFYPPPHVASTLNSWLPSSRFHPFQNSFYPVSSQYRPNKILENETNQKTNTSSQDHSSSLPTLPSSSSKINCNWSDKESTSGSLKEKNPIFTSTPSDDRTREAPEEPKCSTKVSNEFVSETNSTSSSKNKRFSLDFNPKESERKRKRPKRSDEKPTASDKESFPCSICGASYPHKFELNRHIKVSHVRPHRCNECGKGFGHRNYLKVHIETVHLGQKSHQCRLCGKFLSTGGNLNVHIRTIHFGEKKYNCPVCNRSFGQQCNMKTHMKRHYSKSEEV